MKNHGITPRPRSRSGHPLAGAPPHAGWPFPWAPLLLFLWDPSPPCSCLSRGSPRLRGAKGFRARAPRGGRPVLDAGEKRRRRGAALRPYVPRFRNPNACVKSRRFCPTTCRCCHALLSGRDISSSGEQEKLDEEQPAAASQVQFRSENERVNTANRRRGCRRAAGWGVTNKARAQDTRHDPDAHSSRSKATRPASSLYKGAGTRTMLPSKMVQMCTAHV
jgi:hypothetical protein